jgi:hypothetical protein
MIGTIYLLAWHRMHWSASVQALKDSMIFTLDSDVTLEKSGAMRWFAGPSMER